MLVSYVIPSFNHGTFIKSCLNSIKEDIFSEAEIVIIDDGSSDDSVTVVQNWIEENPQVTVHFSKQANAGITTTLNSLVLKAKGEFVRPVASDDEIVKGSTKKLIELLNQNPTCLMSFGDSSTISSSGKIISKSHINYLGRNSNIYVKHLKKAVISAWAIAGPAFVYRKNFQSQVGKYDESLLIEDWNMYLRLASADRLIFLPEIVARYRLHTHNTSMTGDRFKRIKNLKSQYAGGFKNLEYFVSGYQLLLRSELQLLKAKISFLEHQFHKTSFYLLKYLVLKVIAASMLLVG